MTVWDTGSDLCHFGPVSGPNSCARSATRCALQIWMQGLSDHDLTTCVDGLEHQMAAQKKHRSRRDFLDNTVMFFFRKNDTRTCFMVGMDSENTPPKLVEHIQEERSQSNLMVTKHPLCEVQGQPC